MESERLRILPMGSRVHVREIQGRRVKIDRPIHGWCSLRSSNGDTILTKNIPQSQKDKARTIHSFASDEVNPQEYSELCRRKNLAELEYHIKVITAHKRESLDKRDNDGATLLMR